MNNLTFDSRYHSSKISEDVIESLIKKHNKQNKNGKIGQEDIRIIEDLKLQEDGRRISMLEAFLILGAIAIGVGYMKVMSFSGMLVTGTPEYFYIPLATCFLNAVFGFISISLILYSKRAIEIMSVTNNH